MDINPYLIFNGNCAEAFQFYERTLGGKIVCMLKFGDTPARDHVPADAHGRIIHTRLEVNGKAIMGSDSCPSDVVRPQGVHVSYAVETPEDAERVFNALCEGGNVTMPFEKTFWSPGFGMVTDRFGIPWMVNTVPVAEPALV